METLYTPQPKRGQVRLPRRLPARAIPSRIGDENLEVCHLVYAGGRDTVFDLSGNDHHGSIAGAVWDDGRHSGWGLTFDGSSSDYVDFTGVPHVVDYTFLIWVYWDNPGDGSSDTVVEYRKNNAIFLRLDGGGSLDYAHADSGGWNYVTLDPISEGWLLSIQQFDSGVGEFRGYYNGSNLVGTLGVGECLQEDRKDNFSGELVADKNYFLGTVGISMLYSRLWSEAEMDRYFEETRAMFGV